MALDEIHWKIVTDGRGIEVLVAREERDILRERLAEVGDELERVKEEANRQKVLRVESYRVANILRDRFAKTGDELREVKEPTGRRYPREPDLRRCGLARVKMETDREKETLMQELFLARRLRASRRLLGDTRKGRQSGGRERKEEQGGGQRYAVGGGGGDCHRCTDHGMFLCQCCGAD